ncbi:glycosyltransferase family 4 protein [Micromonospora sp. NPDC050417]|uniref:glycosyltransferase family 4 protein n=1 Tax=Micromonospora sp. NPDC050417 TaxID=3364280 RepID=UPI00378CFF72
MHVLVTAVGQRTEHWTELFEALCERPGVELTVLVADVTDVTREELARLARRHRRMHYQVLPYLLGERRTGHMASVLFGPGFGAVAVPRPDVVHVIGEAAYLSTWQVVRLCRRRWPTTPLTLYAAQNIVMRFPQPFPLLERRAYQAVSHVFPITPAALDVLRVKGYRGDATIVPLGVDGNRFQPRPTPPSTGAFTAGFVGRLEQHKGLPDLLRAAELIDCDLLLIGEGSLRPLVEEAARRRPGRVVLHGWTEHRNLPALLARMSALVLPSVELIQRNVLPWIGIPLREQFGRVLVEAMACGVPVVGSDVGEIRHVIGAAGLIFPPGDPVALADRLGRLRDHPDLAAELSARGVDRVCEEFTWDQIAHRMYDIWTNLLTARQPDAPGPTSVARDTPVTLAARQVGPANREAKTS